MKKNIFKKIICLLGLGQLYASDLNRQYTLNSMAPKYRSVIESLVHHFYGISADSLRENNQRLSDFDAHQKQLEDNESITQQIPSLFHRVWITPNHSSKEIPEDRLQAYIESIALLNQHGSHQHFFWCMDPEKIPNTCKLLRAQGVNICKIDTSSFICGHLIQALLDDGYIVFASDLIRKEIVHKEGGFYTDIGIRFNQNINSYLKKFKNIFLRRHWGELDIGVIAGRKNDPFLKRNLELIRDIRTRFPQIIQGIDLPKEINHCLLSSYSLMAQLAIVNQDDQIGFIDEGKEVTLMGIGSWYHNLLPLGFLYGHEEGTDSQSAHHYLPNLDLNFIIPDGYLGEGENYKLWKKVLFQFGIHAKKEKHFTDSRSGTAANIILSHHVDHFPKDSMGEEGRKFGFNYVVSHAGFAFKPPSSFFDWMTEIPLTRSFFVGKPNYLKYWNAACKEKPFFFTVPRTIYHKPDLKNPRIFFCGGEWDNRYPLLTRSLDESGFLDWYGPRSLSQKKSYKGFAENLQETMNSSGIALVLHSKFHLDNAEPSMRIFEAAASGAITISDRNPFVEKHFSDSVLFIDQNQSEEEMFNQIREHCIWIFDNPEEACALSKKAHDIFLKHFTLEKMAFNFIRWHQEAVILEKENALLPRRSFSYAYSNAEDVENLLSIVRPQSFTVVNNTDQTLKDIFKFEYRRKTNDTTLRLPTNYKFLACDGTRSSVIHVMNQEDGDEVKSIEQPVVSNIMFLPKTSIEIELPDNVFCTGFNWPHDLSSCRLSYKRGINALFINLE